MSLPSQQAKTLNCLWFLPRNWKHLSNWKEKNRHKFHSVKTKPHISKPLWEFVLKLCTCPYFWAIFGLCLNFVLVALSSLSKRCGSLETKQNRCGGSLRNTVSPNIVSFWRWGDSSQWTGGEKRTSTWILFAVISRLWVLSTGSKDPMSPLSQHWNTLTKSLAQKAWNPHKRKKENIRIEAHLIKYKDCLMTKKQNLVHFVGWESQTIVSSPILPKQI